MGRTALLSHPVALPTKRLRGWSADCEGEDSSTHNLGQNGWRTIANSLQHKAPRLERVKNHARSRNNPHTAHDCLPRPATAGFVIVDSDFQENPIVLRNTLASAICPVMEG